MSAQEENVIYIGSKPVASYVIACISQLQTTEKIVLKARGRAISRAVDVAEILKRRFLKDIISIESIKTDTEQIETNDGRVSNVSAIEIVIRKNGSDLV